MQNTSQTNSKWLKPRQWGLRARARSALSRMRAPADFGQLECLTLFVGTPRAGASLFGALLDAHPNATIANEYNVLGYFLNDNLRHPSRPGLFHDLLRTARVQAGRGRSGYKQGGGIYKYEVPNQYQGRHSAPLHVVGAAKAGPSLVILANEFDALRRLRQVVQVPIRFVCVIRNPFDLLSTLHKPFAAQSEASIKAIGPTVSTSFLDVRANAMRWYSDLHQLGAQITSELGEGSLISVYHDDLVSDPENQLARVCRFLGLSDHADYLKDCSRAVWKKPNKSRDGVVWESSAVRRVKELIYQCPQLADYYGSNLQEHLPKQIAHAV